MPNKQEVSNPQSGKTKPRSPAYPGIALGQAIERTQQIYDHEGKNKAHVPTVFKHWGYTPNSGAGRVVLAALKYYGLVDVEGSGGNRKIQLTELALDILLDKREGSKERKEAIKKAALNPNINSELWDKHEGSLGSRDELEYSLIREMNFTKRGVKEFLLHFYSTLEYAGLTSSSDKPETKDDKKEDKPDKEEVQQQIGQAGMSNVLLPLTSTSWAVLSAEFPLTQEEWDQMEKVLKVMKPGLVENNGTGIQLIPPMIEGGER